MSKSLAIIIFLLLILYSILGMFIEIPKVINNTIYGIISVGALYFLFFHTSVVSDIKTEISDKIAKENEQKNSNK